MKAESSQAGRAPGVFGQRSLFVYCIALLVHKTDFHVPERERERERERDDDDDRETLGADDHARASPAALAPAAVLSVPRRTEKNESNSKFRK